MTINYGSASDRTAGLVKFTVSGTDQATLANAGNWIGELEYFNVSAVKIDQQFFNMVIKESH